VNKVLRSVFIIMITIVTNQSFALTAYDFNFKSIDGQPMPLSQYKGKVLLVVNTASKCGFTPQLKGLQQLYKQYKDQGLVIIGVPSKDFGGQEFSSAFEITSFASKNYAISFPLTELNHVSTIKAHPFYKWAYGHLGDRAIPKWNFHKLLINRNGELIAAYKSQITPTAKQIVNSLETAINTKAKKTD
jgi:glutathione peroxidase